MEPTITQNGALFALHHAPLKKNGDRSQAKPQFGDSDRPRSTLRASASEYPFPPVKAHYRPLERAVKKVRRALGL